MEDLTSLVRQSSIKERNDAQTVDSEMPETTGKFGTGFMTTLLLSKIVEVDGVYYNECTEMWQRFHLNLDRNTTQLQEMLRKYEKILKIFDDLDYEEICPLVEEGYTPG